jgi:hypothetical protein
VNDGIDPIVRLVRDHPDEADFVGRIGPRIIDDAEEMLGLTFPPTYRRFLAEFGCGAFAGQEIYGITGVDLGAPAVPNMVWLTLDENARSGLPDTMVVVYGDAMGGYYVLDTAKSEGGEPPVEAWEPGLSQVNEPLQVVGDDFGSVCAALFREALGQSP